MEPPSVFSHIFENLFLGVDFKSYPLSCNGQPIKLQIWDTAGQGKNACFSVVYIKERFRTITRSYYKGCHGYLVFYDITDRESFERVETWINEIGTCNSVECFFILVERFSTENYSLVLIGAKCDLSEKSRQVSVDDGKVSKINRFQLNM
jgi:GTPase SAR1 family protein